MIRGESAGSTASQCVKVIRGCEGLFTPSPEKWRSSATFNLCKIRKGSGFKVQQSYFEYVTLLLQEPLPAQHIAASAELLPWPI